MRYKSNVFSAHLIGSYSTFFLSWTCNEWMEITNLKLWSNKKNYNKYSFKRLMRTTCSTSFLNIMTNFVRSYFGVISLLPYDINFNTFWTGVVLWFCHFVRTIKIFVIIVVVAVKLHKNVSHLIEKKKEKRIARHQTDLRVHKPFLSNLNNKRK